MLKPSFVNAIAQRYGESTCYQKGCGQSEINKTYSHRIWRQTSVVEKASKLWNGCVRVVVLSTIGISHYEIKELTKILILSQDTLKGPKIHYNRNPQKMGKNRGLIVIHKTSNIAGSSTSGSNRKIRDFIHSMRILEQCPNGWERRICLNFCHTEDYVSMIVYF